MCTVTIKGSPFSASLVCPDGLTETQEVLFPAPETQAPDYAATIALTISRMFTVIDFAALTGNATVNLTLNAKLSKGALIVAKMTASGADRVVTPGTGFSGAAITIPSAGTINVLYAFDGTNFRQLTAPADNVLDGAIIAAKLATDAVETAKIKNDAVTTAKILDKNVTLAKLANGTAAGDILVFNGTTWAVLAKGTDGQVLKMVSGSVAWATDAIS